MGSARATRRLFLSVIGSELEGHPRRASILADFHDLEPPTL
ncbi:MAG: hypothetical protein Q8K58_03725 [Acidimicrobiales bacterium]|nr:hypothetical protein [Acidimicrobiales bacterium]